MDLTAQDADNLLKLIARVNITGAEATTVALIQQKLVILARGDVAPAAPASEDELVPPATKPSETVAELEETK